MLTHPQQNDVAERKNRHILEVAQAMLHEKHMPNYYWAELASMAVYIMNRCTTIGAHELTSHEVYVGKKSALSHLQVFESIAYVCILAGKRQKLDQMFEKVHFHGVYI